MNKRETPTIDAAIGAERETRDTGNEATRADEQGEAAAPDAPTGIEENDGMNTVLGAAPGTGIQTDVSDE